MPGGRVAGLTDSGVIAPALRWKPRTRPSSSTTAQIVPPRVTSTAETTQAGRPSSATSRGVASGRLPVPGT